MELRERLELLARRGLLPPGARRGPAGPRADPQALARALGGRVLARGGAACVQVEREQPWAGGCDLAALAWLCGVRAAPSGGRVVFLDLETTGLAGGTGTAAVVVGLARLEEGRLRLVQLVLPDLSEEAALLAALHEAWGDGAVLVTYNGQRFDLPLLATRCVLAGCPPPAVRLHLDLIHPARRLYRRLLGRCDQRSLERYLLGTERPGDIAGSDVPALYTRYLAEGDPGLLVPVLEHNRRDLVGLAGIAAALAARAAGSVSASAGLPPEELPGWAVLHLQRGQPGRALELAREALRRLHPGERAYAAALAVLARAARRAGDAGTAVQAWLTLAALPGREGEAALVELAKHFEHRERDPERALECVERALLRLSLRLLRGAGPAGPSPADRRRLEDLERRRSRLLRRLLRRAGGARRAGRGHAAG